MIVAAIVVVVVALAVVVLAIVVRRRRRPRDGVELFQRQIEALSAEARRPVVDRVHALRDDDEPGERRG